MSTTTEVKKLLSFGEVQNDSNLRFSDISSEAYRKYTFPGGEEILIELPLALNVSKVGGHRLVDASGVSHYVPKGWIHLEWKPKKNAPHFVM